MKNHWWAIRRDRFRGAGLLLVILVSSLILTVGLALGTLCTLNLNFARADLMDQQFRTMARSATEQVIAILNQRGGLKIGMPNPLQPTQPPLLASLIPPTLFDTTDGFPGRCTITFDTTAPFYSYDNTASEFESTAGYHNRTVPPYSVDLIFNLTIGSTPSHYEAVLRQCWQYDGFSGSGSVNVNGGVVQGSVFSNGNGGANLVVIGNGASSVTGDAAVQTTDLTSINANLPNLQGRKRYGVPLVNLPLGTSPSDFLSPNPAGFVNVTMPAPPTKPYGKATPPGAPPCPCATPPPSPPSTSGGVDLSHIINSAYITVSTTMHTHACSCTGAGGCPINTTAYYAWLPDLHGQDTSVIIPDIINHNLYFMTSNVTVSPDSAGHQEFLINGSLFNHAYLYRLPSSPSSPCPASFTAQNIVPVGVETTAPGTLTITNSVLQLTGTGDFTDVQGSNAALYTGGSLRLSGGNLNADTKGMVITANGVTLSCGGTFNGYISSGTNILIQQPTAAPGSPTPPPNPLSITGGLIADRGTLTLNNLTTVHYGPQYSKVLNQFADVEPMMFRQISY